MRRLITGALLAGGVVWAFGAGATRAQSASARLNIAVICVKCIPDDMPQEAYNAGTVLVDQNTGDLWFYPALSRGVKPRKLGTFTQLGAPLLPPAGERRALFRALRARAARARRRCRRQSPAR